MRAPIGAAISAETARARRPVVRLEARPISERCGFLQCSVRQTAFFQSARTTAWRLTSKCPTAHRPGRSQLFRAREIWCADEFSVRQVHFASRIGDRLGKAEVDDFHFDFYRIGFTPS